MVGLGAAAGNGKRTTTDCTGLTGRGCGACARIASISALCSSDLLICLCAHSAHHTQSVVYGKNKIIYVSTPVHTF